MLIESNIFDREDDAIDTCCMLLLWIVKLSMISGWIKLSLLQLTMSVLIKFPLIDILVVDLFRDVIDADEV